MSVLSVARDLGFSTITGKPAELNDETVWHNLTFLDQMVVKQQLCGINAVFFMGGAIAAYLKLYPDKTHADAEREFRERDFETGLIAPSWRDNPDLGPLVARGDVVIRRMSGCLMDDDDDAATTTPPPSTTTSCDYHVLISCRRRKSVEAEVASYGLSAEENLLRLENAGELHFMNKDQMTTLKTDEGEESKCEDVDNNPSPKNDSSPALDEERAMWAKIMKGEVQLCMRPLKDVWQNACEQYPEAKQTVAFISSDGPIVLLVADDKTIVCHVGRCLMPEGPEYIMLRY